MNSTETAVTPAEATTEKKTWITPAATVEQVSDLTKQFSGQGFDLSNCHS